VKHDVIVSHVGSETMAAAGTPRRRAGSTSADLERCVDTAQAASTEAGFAICSTACAFARVLNAALEFQHTVQSDARMRACRANHFRAEALAIWYEEAGLQPGAAAGRGRGLRVGKISGAVGTFAHIGPVAKNVFARAWALRLRRSLRR